MENSNLLTLHYHVENEEGKIIRNHFHLTFEWWPSLLQTITNTKNSFIKLQNYCKFETILHDMKLSSWEKKNLK